MGYCVRSRIAGARGVVMIEMRRAQLSFGDGLIADEVSNLREGWMEPADQVLADDEIVAAVHEALARRHPKSRSRGRHGTPAEVVLRLLILKHVRNVSYAVLEREVRADLVYRDFTRVGAGKMPDAKTMGRWGLALDPQLLRRVHDRIIKIAHKRGIVAGRRMRVDSGGDQYPLSDRQHAAGRWGAGTDPDHEEDHGHRRCDRNQGSRPQPEREAAAA